jgi:hypothetical protein
MGVDYDDLLDKIEARLKAMLPDVNVEVEPTTVGLAGKPDIGIYQTALEPQFVHQGAADPYQKDVMIDVICAEYDPEGVRKAIRRRNELYNRVWDALLADKTFLGAGRAFTLESGEFQSAKDQAGYNAAGTLRIRIQTFN